MNRPFILLSITAAIVLLALPSCAQDAAKLSDTEIMKRLAGRWQWRPTSKFFIDITFAKEQTFTAVKGAGDLGYTASGSWKVEKGVLRMTTKRISFGKEEVDVEKSSMDWTIVPESRILSIDDSLLRLDKSKLWKEGLEFKKAK